MKVGTRKEKEVSKLNNEIYLRILAITSEYCVLGKVVIGEIVDFIDEEYTVTRKVSKIDSKEDELPITGQECFCGDGLGRVMSFDFSPPNNYIQVSTYIRDRECKWDRHNVELLDPRRSI
jgi:hypothetical protein